MASPNKENRIFAEIMDDIGDPAPLKLGEKPNKDPGLGIWVIEFARAGVQEIEDEYLRKHAAFLDYLENREAA